MTELKNPRPTERAGAKTLFQDALGILFCGIGLFFAVSIVLFSLGWSSKPGLVSTFTWPVIELVAQLGHASAVLFALGLTALGTILFLRPAATGFLRPVLALLVVSCGAALTLGAFGTGGELGDWLPGLLAGAAGRVLSAVLGAALLWLGWTLIGERAPRGSTADALQRLGLSARHDASGGVSSAEAALLTDAHPTTPRPAPSRPGGARREEARGSERALRPDAAPRLHAPAKVPSASAARPEVFPLPRKTLPQTESVEPLRPAPEPSRARSAAETVAVPPPSPSWEEPSEEALPEDEPLESLGLADEDSDERHDEQDEHDEEEDLVEESDQELATGLAETFEAEDLEERLRPAEQALDPERAEGAPALAAPRASWEQVGLFDEDEEAQGEEVEEEELEVETPRPRSAADLTPSFDFGASALVKHLHEPELTEDPFAEPSPAESAAAEVAWPELASSPAPEAVEPSPPPALAEREVAAKPPRKRAKKAPAKDSPAHEDSAPDFLLQPVPARSASEPTPAGDEERERWNQLVFEAGCAILEQKRVAVSMLERRFGIDFDRACLVLDHLQQAGLIGPYLGGRTREILLDVEEWNARAPHAPESL